jgi:hypothetical protein
MVPKAAVTAEVPEFVNVSPLASVCRMRLMELATVTVTAIVAEPVVADAVPMQKVTMNSGSVKNTYSFFMGMVTPIQFGANDASSPGSLDIGLGLLAFSPGQVRRGFWA